MIMEISRTFDQIFKEHLDGVYVFFISSIVKLIEILFSSYVDFFI